MYALPIDARLQTAKYHQYMQNITANLRIVVFPSQKFYVFLVGSTSFHLYPILMKLH